MRFDLILSEILTVTLAICTVISMLLSAFRCTVYHSLYGDPRKAPTGILPSGSMALGKHWEGRHTDGIIYILFFLIFEKF